MYLQGPPEVSAERVQWGHLGDTVLVDCFVNSASPRSVAVTWTHRGKDVDTSEY